MRNNDFFSLLMPLVLRKFQSVLFLPFLDLTLEQLTQGQLTLQNTTLRVGILYAF